MSDKQCSDKAQTGPGLKPAVAVKAAVMAPKTGAKSTGTSPNSHQRGTDNGAK